MDAQVYFRHLPYSEALATAARTKTAEQVTRFVAKPLRVKITLEINGHQHVASCDVVCGNGHFVHASEASENMYAAIDLLADKLYGQLCRHKEKLHRHRFGELDEMPGERFVDDLPTKDLEPIDAVDILQCEEKRRRLG